MAGNINPNDIDIRLSLKLPHINLVLEGLGKLPFERVEGVYNGIRGAAVQQLNEAERAQAAAVNEAEERAAAAKAPPETVESEPIEQRPHPDNGPHGVAEGTITPGEQ